jgi:hypothetical protein
MTYQLESHVGRTWFHCDPLTKSLTRFRGSEESQYLHLWKGELS